MGKCRDCKYIKSKDKTYGYCDKIAQVLKINHYIGYLAPNLDWGCASFELNMGGSNE